MNITGTQISYYIICKRKLWLFSHNIECEQESDNVLSGKLLHENSYNRKRKELLFGPVKIDWIDFDNKIVHEIKKSDRIEEAHIWQLKYYLWYLKKSNICQFSGEINYTKLKKIKKISLNADDEIKLKKIIENIISIINLEYPPDVKTDNKICKSCAYYELCFI